MPSRTAAYEAARTDYSRQQDLHRSPSQPSLTHTVTTEQSDDQRLGGPRTPYTASFELDQATIDDHGHILPKGAAPARVGATSAPSSSWGRSSSRSSRIIRKVPSMPSRAPIPEFVAPANTPAPPPPQFQYQSRSQLQTSTDADEKRKSKRLSLTRSLHDLRERRAADKARKRASTTSEKLSSRVPDLPPELPPVPSIPSMYRNPGSSTRPELISSPRPRASMPPLPLQPVNGRGNASVPPQPPTPRSSGFASFIRKLTGKKTKAEPVPPLPPMPPMPSRHQQTRIQRSAPRQAATTMPSQGPFGSMGRKTRLDNIPQVEAPKGVRDMLSDMKGESGSVQRCGTQPERQSLIKRVPVPQYSMDDFEPIIDLRDLPAPQELPVEIEAAAEARAAAFAQLVGTRPSVASVKSTDSTESRRVRAPVPPPRTNSPRSKQSTPASKAGSDMPVTPPPEAMDVFTSGTYAGPSPLIAREVSDEPMTMSAEGHPTDGMGMELKSVRRFSVTSQVIVIGPDNPSIDCTTGRELRPPVLNVVTRRSVTGEAGGNSSNHKISYFSEDETTTDDEDIRSSAGASLGLRQTSFDTRPAVPPLTTPTPMVGGSPLTFGVAAPHPAEPHQASPIPHAFTPESPTDRDSFGHGFIPPRSVLSRQDSSDDFHSAYGHGSVFGSEAGHGSLYHQPMSRQAIYGGSRSDLGHRPIPHAPYGASSSDIGHGYSVQAARMFIASASRSDLGHGGLAHHPFIAAQGRSDLPRRQLGGAAIATSRSPMASRSDLGHSRSPMASRSDLGYAISAMASRSDLGHGVRTHPRFESSHGLRQASKSDHGHGVPLGAKRSVPDVRLSAKTSFPDLQSTASTRTLSRQTLTSNSDLNSTLNSTWSGRSSSHSHRGPSRQASLADVALSRGLSRRHARKMSYDEFGRQIASSQGHGSVSGHGHDSDDFHSALDHASSIGHGSNWLHEDPRATPGPRTPRTPRSDPRLAGSSPAREAPLGDGLSNFDGGSGGKARLRSLTRKMSKPKQPPTSYDAYHEKQVQLLTRRKSCKPTLHSEASIAAEINEVSDKEDARLMEACFMA